MKKAGLFAVALFVMFGSMFIMTGCSGSDEPREQPAIIVNPDLVHWIANQPVFIDGGAFPSYWERATRVNVINNTDENRVIRLRITSYNTQNNVLQTIELDVTAIASTTTQVNTDFRNLALHGAPSLFTAESTTQIEMVPGFPSESRNTWQDFWDNPLYAGLFIGIGSLIVIAVIIIIVVLAIRNRKPLPIPAHANATFPKPQPFQSKFCSACGNSLPVGSGFCNKCGKQV